jgi:hypothetical protein
VVVLVVLQLALLPGGGKGGWGLRSRPPLGVWAAEEGAVRRRRVMAVSGAGRGSACCLGLKGVVSAYVICGFMS